ncbi:hypothetical protein [Rothia aeria]|uniref:hypothetical protein n=1 Tax=Rothia aeria TaxID=172042 RepID=UPI00051DDAC2|nr:hypothetical protein [Rothia aeria]KGJ00394.1 hypothetical protein ES20_05730 [Rothia aeria]KGJ34321.1 hypothetical protein ES18_05205 [Rothia aeria]
MSGYSPVPKPRRGHRRVSGAGAPAEAEPRIAGVNAPEPGRVQRVKPSGGHRAASGQQGTGATRGVPGGRSQQALSADELARLRWVQEMKEQKPPHY